jgi:putative acyl-CoA dehydrogenase
VFSIPLFSLSALIPIKQERTMSSTKESMAEPKAEPTAATHEVFNQAGALENHNLYLGDQALREAIQRQAPAADAMLRDYGQLCGLPEFIEQGFQANAHKPVLHTHDRFGERLDAIEFHPSYHYLMEQAFSAGLHSSPWAQPGLGAHAARAAKYYLHTQVEAAHGCPVTMTFASAPTLQLNPVIAKQWLPKVLATAYDPRNIHYSEKSALTIGMGMTEKQGGSDVRANTTKARPLGEVEGCEAYALVGHKWFLSAPMCDGFLVLAQTNAGLSCFLVPRWHPDGHKNPLEMQRLKDKMGNVANASSEVEFRGALGWLIGAPGRGVPSIIQMVAMTRFDCMIGSSAGQRQAVVQAAHHASNREAFGKRLIDQPVMRNVIADLQLEVEGSLAMTMRMAQALDGQSEQDQLLLRLGTAVGKYWICKRTPQHAYEAMECIGGNGVMEDCIMPRLYREAPINAIWEGSGNIQALDVRRAMSRSPDAVDAWMAELLSTANSDPRQDALVEKLKHELDTADEGSSRRLVELLALSMQGSLLLRSGNTAIAEAFLVGRCQSPSHHFGALPAGLNLDLLIDRANSHCYDS